MGFDEDLTIAAEMAVLKSPPVRGASTRTYPWHCRALRNNARSRSQNCVWFRIVNKPFRARGLSIKVSTLKSHLGPLLVVALTGWVTVNGQNAELTSDREPHAT